MIVEPMRWTHGVCMLAGLLLAGVGDAQILENDPAVLTAETVDSSMRRAVDYLYAIRNEQGIWDAPILPRILDEGKPVWDDIQDIFWGGRTALALNALAAAGQQKDPRFRRAADWLMRQKLWSVYAIGLRLELQYRLQDRGDYSRVLRADTSALLRAGVPTPRGVTWGYLSPPIVVHYTSPAGPVGSREDPDKRSPMPPGDYSNVNYAVLGLWAANILGQEVSGTLWRELEKQWVLGQHPNGGWAYFDRKYHHSELVGTARWDDMSGSMTAAGIASLHLVVDQYYTRSSAERGVHRHSPAYRSIVRGLEWLGENFRVDCNPGRTQPFCTTYYYYNLERVAEATGLRYFGLHDWFREIAPRILSHQRTSGAYRFMTPIPVVGPAWQRDDLVDTSFCLLFLAHGSGPMVFSKLAHRGNWDNYLNDISILTKYVGWQMECETNWQIVTIDSPPEQWCSARLLYISDHELLDFTDQERARLKRFVELGGLLVFHADIENRLGRVWRYQTGLFLSELWPGLEPTELDRDRDPLMTIHRELRVPPQQVWRFGPPWRTYAFLLNGQPARCWQGRRYATGKQAFSLGANLFHYAMNKTPETKWPSRLRNFAQPFLDEPLSGGPALRVGRLVHSEKPLHWDPEPLAWPRLARRWPDLTGRRMEIVPVTPQELAEANLSVLHMTGGETCSLNAEDQQALLTWLNNGGTMLADQAGGPRDAGRFDESFRRLIESMFGQDRLLAYFPLGQKAPEFEHRNVGGLPRKMSSPRLEVVRIADRPAVIYSQNDLTCALLDCPNPLVRGFTPEGAEAFLVWLLGDVLDEGLAPEPPEERHDPPEPAPPAEKPRVWVDILPPPGIRNAPTSQPIAP